jgi:CBS domain-containing protein
VKLIPSDDCYILPKCIKQLISSNLEEAMTPLALLMNREIKGVSPEATLREAAEQMRDRHVGSLLVGEGDEKIGILSEGDLVRLAMAEGLDPQKNRVVSIMSSPIISIDIDQTAKEANNLMARKGIRHLVVTDRGKIVGIISVRDLVICFKNRI